MNHKSIVELLLSKEKNSANSVFLRQPRNGVWHELSWAEVMHKARKVAGFLKQEGLEPGAHVSIFSKNCDLNGDFCEK